MIKWKGRIEIKVPQFLTFVSKWINEQQIQRLRICEDNLSQFNKPYNLMHAMYPWEYIITKV